jgi:hypothetical protein
VGGSLTHISGPLSPKTPGLVGELLVTCDEAVERSSEGETGTTDTDVFKKTEVLNLMLNTVLIPIKATLGFVRLDGTDVVGRAGRQGRDESLGRGLNLESGSGGTLGLLLGGIFGEESDQKRQLRALDTLDQIVGDGILILLAEALDFVNDLTGVVLNLESGIHSTQVQVAREESTDLLEELQIKTLTLGVHGSTDVIEDGEDSRRLLTVDKLTHNLVVEELDGGPLNTLRVVLFLLSTEGQLNEKLLELLVYVVDTELLEAILLENLETINIQDTNNDAVLHLVLVKSSVGFLDKEIENARVDSLGKRVTRGISLDNVGRDVVSLSLVTHTGSQGTEGQSTLKSVSINLPHLSSELDGSSIGKDGVSLRVLGESGVTKVANTGNHTPDLLLFGIRDTNASHGLLNSERKGQQVKHKNRKVMHQKMGG